MVTFDPTPLGPLPPLDWRTIAGARRHALDPALHPAFLARDLAEGNLDRLFRGALCVTTGQQPGLLTGPMFTLFKALSAVTLARALERRLEEPVVPVFWVAGDDHDFTEANHCFVLNRQGQVERLELRHREEAAPLTPLYREPVGPEIADVLERVRAATPESEFRPAVLAWLERHYHPEADLASAFAGALAELLGPSGLVVLLASHPAAKRAMGPWLVRAVSRAADLDRALAERARSLEAEGWPVPVPVGGGATTVMIEGRLGRDRLMLHDGRLTARRGGEAWEVTELAELVRREPERFSPNVLLRPVIEAAILPTLAYAAGSGELAYLPQSDPIYRTLGVHAQARLPRWSARVIEARVEKVLHKYELTAEALEQRSGQLETELLREELPVEAREALQALRQTLDREYLRLLPAASQVDPTLRKPIESARNAALAGVADVEKRLLSHVKKQSDIAASQLVRARTSLFPLGRPQERVLGTVSFLVRYGPGFVNAALAAATQWAASLEPAPRRA